jgi:alpha-tubulin suppressor-like RCC1 family protein
MSQSTGGSLINRLEPVDIIGLPEHVTALAAGFAHTCALNSQGQMLCWGDNSHGQLGDENPDVHTSPVTVSGLDKDVVKVAAGNGYTCAITGQGAVKCWGRNDWHQLGDSTEIDRSTAADVTGLTSGAVDIAVGNVHACVLLQNSTVLGTDGLWLSRE